MRPAFLPPLSEPAPAPVPEAPDAFALALARATGDDPQLFEGLLRIAWEAYVIAGLPYGLDEEGMALWWAARMEGPDW